MRTDTIIKLLDICLRSPYFCYKAVLRTKGRSSNGFSSFCNSNSTYIWSSLKGWLSTAPSRLRIWKRYRTIQWTLDWTLRFRTEIIARGYNDLHMRMRVVVVDKKIIVCMAAKSVVLSTEDHQVVGQGCLPLSSTRSSPCSQQLALLALNCLILLRILFFFF